MPYQYRYTDERDRPLGQCPECLADLTVEGSIDVSLSINGQNVTMPTRLLNDGNLVDIEDYVWHGLHSATECAKCGANLGDVAFEDNVAPK